MSALKLTLDASVSIADVCLHGSDKAAATVLLPLLKAEGVPDGTPVEVDMTPRKYDWLATAKWDASAMDHKENHES